MPTNSSVNLKITNNADGFDIAGGTIARKVTVSGADIGIVGSGTNVYTFPVSTSTLASLALTEAFTNKTYNGLTITATTGTFTLTNGKTLAVTNILTFSGTDSTIMTFPSSSATVAGLGITQTFTGINIFSPTARSSGVASYFTINAPADTGITAATESIGINHVGATRTWADGTTTTQREYYFGAPTYNKTTAAATFTNLATLAISGSPTAGAGVTFTHPWALWVQGGNSHFGAQIGATQAAINGTGAEFNDSNNTTGGHTVAIQNTNNGTSAFSGVSLGNDQTVDGGATSHFFGIYLNSSTFTDTTFGTAFAIASQASLETTDGPLALAAIAASGYINFIVGGSAAGNEVYRSTTTENYNAVISSQTTVPVGSVTVQANYSSVVAVSYSIASGKTLTIGSGGNFKII